MTDYRNTADKENPQTKPPYTDRRDQSDRRSGNDRRGEIRYELDRRKNHGRRNSDKDPWKDSLQD